MNEINSEFLSAVAIVVLLLGVAGYFAWRQWRTLRQLPGRADLAPEDRRFQLRMAWRRLTASALMVVMAGLLVGTYGLGQERQAEHYRQAEGARNDTEEHRQEVRDFLARYGRFWGFFAALLLGLVVLAFMDVWAIRRFARSQFRRIREERRAMIEREVAQLRKERNGF